MNLNELPEPIKERFTNPLIFSFICSWLFINWQIVFSIFVGSRPIEIEGFKTIFSFIKARSDQQHLLLQPLLFSAGFTIFFPIIKNLIGAFNTWAYTWGTKWNLKIGKEGAISTKYCIRLQEDLKEQEKLLQSTIENASEYVDLNNQLNLNIHKAENEIIGLKTSLAEKNFFITQSTDYQILNGYWRNNYQFKDETGGTEEVYIQNGQYFIIPPIGNKIHTFNIINFYYNNESQICVFVKELIPPLKNSRPPSEHYGINQLRFLNIDLLEGTENGTTEIRYERKSKPGN